MKKTILLMIVFSIIPIFAFGRGPGKKKTDNHQTMLVIRPGEEMDDEEQINTYYYPGENGIKAQKKKKDYGANWKSYEIRLDGAVSKGIGDKNDTNGSYHIAGLYHYSPKLALGAGTGLYYSVGPYATHGVPLIAIIDYNIKDFKGLCPFIEGYGGFVIGFKNASLDCCAPNYGLFGVKVGLLYNINKTFSIRFAANFFNTTDNNSSKHGNTAESCVGPCGSIGYRF